jgi:hypothetical protein
MLVEAERLICANHDCRAELIVAKKPALEKQNVRCACGSELRKIYHPPKVTVLGRAFGNLRQPLPDGADAALAGSSRAGEAD